eukprot:354340_1
MTEFRILITLNKRRGILCRLKDDMSINEIKDEIKRRNTWSNTINNVPKSAMHLVYTLNGHDVAVLDQEGLRDLKDDWNRDKKLILNVDIKDINVMENNKNNGNIDEAEIRLRQSIIPFDLDERRQEQDRNDRLLLAEQRQLLADRLYNRHKKATDIKLIFNGGKSSRKENQDDFYVFREKLKRHFKVNNRNMDAEDQYYALLDDKIIGSPACDIIARQLKDINPLLDSEPDEIEAAILNGEHSWKLIVERIWKALGEYYGESNRGLRLMNEFGNIRIKDGDINQFISNLKSKYAQIKTEFESSDYYHGINNKTDVEYGNMIIAGLPEGLRQFMFDTAVSQKKKYFPFKYVIELLYEAESRKQMEEFTLWGSNIKSKFSTDCMDTSNNNVTQNCDSYNINVVTREFHTNNNRRFGGNYRNYKDRDKHDRNTPCCFNLTITTCKKYRKGCDLYHFQDWQKREIKHKRAEWARKLCKNYNRCQILSCPFKHSVERRKTLGSCKWDGKCTRHCCKFMHYKQSDTHKDLVHINFNTVNMENDRNYEIRGQSDINNEELDSFIIKTNITESIKDEKYDFNEVEHYIENLEKRIENIDEKK